MGAVRFSIDSGLVSQLQGVLPLKVFVETGTYEGASVDAVLPRFDEIHTIELSATLYAKAADRFAANSKVHVHHGRSRDVLAELVPKLKRKPALFWLDAHWCDETSEGAEEQCPLLEELDAIASISDQSVVMIDDARLFMAPPPAPATSDGWPTLSEVLSRLTALNPGHELLVIDDVLVFFPPAAAETLREYARHHAIDWLIELQASRRIANQLDRLGHEVKKLTGGRGIRQDVKSVGRRLDPLAAQVEMVSAQVRSLEEAVLGVRKRVRASQETLADFPGMRGELQSVEGQLRLVRPAIEALRDEVREASARSKDSQADIQQRLDPLGRLEPIAAQLEALGGTVESLHRNVELLQERSEQSRQALDRLPDPREEIRSLDGAVEELKRELEPLSPRLEKGLGEQAEQSAAALEQLSEIRGQLQALEARLQEMSKRRGPLRAIGALFGAGEAAEAAREGEPSAPAAEAPAAGQSASEERAAAESAAELDRPAPATPEPPASESSPDQLFGGSDRPAAEAPPMAAALGAPPPPHPPRPLRIPKRYRRVEPPEDPPRISIVTLSHSNPGFLDRTIRSVLEQGYEPLEFIVEASEDDGLTAELLERYSDRLAHSEGHRNGDVARTLNLGFERSTGALMSYLDPLGILLPGALSYVAQYFQGHPEVDVVYGHRIYLDADDFEIGRAVLPRHDNEVLGWANYVPPEGLFWRREAWDAVGATIEEDLSEAFDWELMLCFRDAGARIERVPRFLAGIRVEGRDGATAGDSKEARRLRETVHGRQVSDEETAAAVRSYARRHALLQRLYRMRVLRY